MNFPIQEFVDKNKLELVSLSATTEAGPALNLNSAQVGANFFVCENKEKEDSK